MPYSFQAYYNLNISLTWEDMQKLRLREDRHGSAQLLEDYMTRYFQDS